MKFLVNSPESKTKRALLRKNQTDVEKLLWSKLRGRQLGAKFVRQYGFGPYILDFYCSGHKLAIEVDGGQHNENEQRIKDEHRTKYLAYHGVKILRFWNNEVLANLSGVCEEILKFVTPPHLPLS